MPSPGAPVPPRLPIEDSYFELLADTLESLDLPARGQFLQRYFRAIAHLDLDDTQITSLPAAYSYSEPGSMSPAASSFFG